MIIFFRGNGLKVLTEQINNLTTNRRQLLVLRKLDPHNLLIFTPHNFVPLLGKQRIFELSCGKF